MKTSGKISGIWIVKSFFCLKTNITVNFEVYLNRSSRIMAGKNTRGAAEKTDMIDQLTKILDNKLDPITQKLEDMETSLNTALSEMNKISDLESQVSKQQSKIENLGKENDSLKGGIWVLKEQLLKQETFSRRKNLKINGLMEIGSETLEQKVLQVFSDVGIKLSPRDIERIHFYGPHRKNQPRGVLMCFHHHKDKVSVIIKKKALQQKKIFISDDYPEEVMRRRKVLVPTYYKALQICPNLNPKLRVDTLVLGGKEYGLHNIKLLPVKELLPASVFTKELNGLTAFFTSQSPLSNHYACTFYEDGVFFKSSEECFMYKKALLFKDETTAQQILEADRPEIAKVLRKIQVHEKSYQSQTRRGEGGGDWCFIYSVPQCSSKLPNTDVASAP